MSHGQEVRFLNGKMATGLLRKLGVREIRKRSDIQVPGILSPGHLMNAHPEGPHRGMAWFLMVPALAAAHLTGPAGRVGQGRIDPLRPRRTVYTATSPHE